MRILALVILATAFLGVQARATTLSDPAGDFLPTFSGPPGSDDLDVISTTAVLSGTNLVLSATMNGAIGATPGGLYVWGVNRGAGAATANFSSLGLPGIIFDSVVIVTPDGAGQVVLLDSGTPVATPLAAGSVTISANTFLAVVPIAMLPTKGFATLDYTQNLWPRYGGVSTDDQISDFAPDSSMASITAPEPTSLALWALCSLACLALAPRRVAAY